MSCKRRPIYFSMNGCSSLQRQSTAAPGPSQQTMIASKLWSPALIHSRPRLAILRPRPEFARVAARSSKCRTLGTLTPRDRGRFANRCAPVGAAAGVQFECQCGARCGVIPATCNCPSGQRPLPLLATPQFRRARGRNAADVNRTGEGCRVRRTRRTGMLHVVC